MKAPHFIYWTQLPTDDRKSQTLYARCLLSYAIQQITGREITPAVLMEQLCYTNKGKPFLPGEALEFSISHSGNITVVAMGKNSRVGIDIEFGKKKILQQYHDLYMHADELTLLGECKSNADAYCTQVWTKKEAIAKLFGEGWSIGYRKINTTLSANSVEVADKNFFITAVHLLENICCTLASEVSNSYVVHFVPLAVLPGIHESYEPVEPNSNGKANVSRA